MSKVTTIGDRVELQNNDIITYGFVRFIGAIKNKRGIFYGIELDEPEGSNNGSFGKIEYFRCDMRHGLFVKKKFIARTLIPKSNLQTPRVTVADKVFVTDRNCNGIIKYIGTPYFVDNIYYGIELDRRIGTSNGTVNKRWCFECEDKYGVFVQSYQFNVLSSLPSSPRSPRYVSNIIYEESTSKGLEWRQLLVSGFIRPFEKDIKEKYKLNQEFEIFKQFHDTVTDIIYSYQNYEIWNDEWSSTGIQIDKSKVEILILSNQQPTAYGNEVISTGVFKWKIKIKEFQTNKYKVSPFIGIIENKERYLKKNKDSAFWNRNGYQFCGGNGLLQGMDNYSAICDYRFNNINDILEFILDLNNLTIQIIINGIDYGIAFRNIKKTSYRLALGVSACNGSKFVLL